MKPFSLESQGKVKLVLLFPALIWPRCSLSLSVSILRRKRHHHTLDIVQSLSLPLSLIRNAFPCTNDYFRNSTLIFVSYLGSAFPAQCSFLNFFSVLCIADINRLEESRPSLGLSLCALAPLSGHSELSVRGPIC